MIHQGDEIVHPGIKVAAVVLQVVDVLLQVGHGLFILAGRRREPVFFRAHHKKIHGIIEIRILGFGQGKTAHVLIEHHHRPPGDFQHSQLQVINIVGEPQFAEQDGIGPPAEKRFVDLIIHDLDQGPGKSLPLDRMADHFFGCRRYRRLAGGITGLAGSSGFARGSAGLGRGASGWPGVTGMAGSSGVTAASGGVAGRRRRFRGCRRRFVRHSGDVTSFRPWL